MFKILDFNKTLDDTKDIKIFFGNHDGIQRYDRFKYKKSEKLISMQRSATWFPTEISYARDKASYSTLKKSTQELYDSNIIFQSSADSLANKFLDNILSVYITSSEWESIIKWQAHFELIHSESYSYNIRQVYDSPERLFNLNLKKEEIKSRLEIENDCYSSLPKRMEEGTLDDKKRAILEVILRQYILENIRFFISFLYTFKINELNDEKLQGSVNNIRLILNDETIHTVIFKTLINILRKNKSEGFTHLFDENFENDCIRYFDEVIESELIWFDYLNSIEELQGFNKKVVKEFLEFYSYKALKLIGTSEDKIKKYNTKKNELIKFFEKKRNINDIKSLPQENNILSYNIATLENMNYKLEIDLEKEFLDAI